MPSNRYGWDSSKSGKGTDAKVIMVHLYQQEGIDQLYVLSQRQAAALLKISTYLEWQNRYDVLPTEIMDSDDFDAWNAQIKQRLITPMEICAEIINCIENDNDVKQALMSFLAANWQFAPSDNPPNLPNPDSANDIAGIHNPTCDPDVTWAQAWQIVEWSVTIVSDALQIIETETNVVEVVGAVSQMTGLDESSVDAIVSYINLLQEFIAENYDAAVTEAYMQDLACQIFCIASIDCEISIDTIYFILEARVMSYFETSGTFTSLDDVIDFLTSGDLDTEIVADAALWLVWGGAKLANWFMNGASNGRVDIGSRILQTLLKLAVNDANNDWATLCIYCAWCNYLDYALDAYGFVQYGSSTNGGQVAGVGLVPGVDTGNNIRQLVVRSPYTPDISLTRIKAYVRFQAYTGTHDASFKGVIIRGYLDAVEQFELIETFANDKLTGDYIITWNGSKTVDTVELAYIPVNLDGSGTPPSAGNSCILALEMRGEGDDPYELDNCS